jgi:hypothetical protein
MLKKIKNLNLSNYLLCLPCAYVPKSDYAVYGLSILVFGYFVTMGILFLINRKEMKKKKPIRDKFYRFVVIPFFIIVCIIFFTWIIKVLV